MVLYENISIFEQSLQIANIQILQMVILQPQY